MSYFDTSLSPSRCPEDSLRLAQAQKLSPLSFVNNQELLWYVIMHMTFVLSALLMGVLDRISFAAHREH
jgi:uncharacterized protein (TIGR00645 family)